MTPLELYVGQTLDGKYHLERLLGQGGMGAVYLATHLGTDRYVALKLIAPQFMRNAEFVERFKREARAAGRLRHPNVVDVTDFGFSGEGSNRVAYLVMEYLDGCTLSDVLAEESRLPLYWVVDIIEQVCAAVHEAHQQGIVHRDLKPDNIWLEPNGLGGYRVKVLDFGIAKLGEVAQVTELPSAISSDYSNETPTLMAPGASGGLAAAATVGDSDLRQTLPLNLESETLIQPSASNAPHTQVADDPDQKTRLLVEAEQTAPAARLTLGALDRSATTGLTRVGAILGTPLYMSPEQCRGERLDARSDIYSLGIISYQMLTGAPPFTGQTASVITAHKETQPAPIRQLNRKLPKRVSRVIMSALEKNPAARPQTAIAFASEIRANVDGLGALYRRAFSLYSEYFPKFLKLSLMAHIPLIVLTAAMLALQLAQPYLSKGAFISGALCIGLLQIPATLAAAWIISAVTAIVVTQLTAAPLKPVALRPAFAVLRRRWRPFVRTAVRIFLKIVLGWILFVIPGLVITVRNMLWSPVVLMENLQGKSALKRARELASRSWRIVISVAIVQLFVPSIVNLLMARLVGLSREVHVTPRIKIAGQVTSLTTIFVLPLLSIVPALVYLKMRQFGGETLDDVMTQLEDVEGAKSRWQQRMRSRLTVTPQTRTPS